MEKAPITRNQRRLLDAICDSQDFSEQVTASEEIWGCKFKEIRRSFSRLSNLAFIEWIPQEETCFEPRWAITEKGVRYLTETM